MRFCSSPVGVRLIGIGLLPVLAVISSCAGTEVPLASPSVTTPALVAAPAEVPVSAPAPVLQPKSKPKNIYSETGIAAWYGKDLHGKKTASGEVFDMYGLSAAHRTLPFGTVVNVTNLDNFKSIEVRINDRGPFLKSRFLDLSYGAAKALGFVSLGTARIRIETLDAVHGPVQYTVQAAVFNEEENARMLKERLDTKFEVVNIVPFETNIARFYRVQVGAYTSEVRAEHVAGKLMLEGLEPIVLRKD
ncbi:MAG: septal ring lytic transglycosylase RlpA family protein [Nitrospirota bacterium]